MPTHEVLPHPEPLSGASYSAVELAPDNRCVWMLDQRLLPERECYLELTDVALVARGIGEMVVRGAPAIGIAAAYGMALAARAGEDLARAAELLTAARPTAVNLSWAVQRCLEASRGSGKTDVAESLADFARRIHQDDVASCRRMGQLGQERLPSECTVLTHCNAGALATGGYGTALGVLRAAREAGKRVRVLADETRPYLQGARLTAWELARDGIAVEVIADAAAGSLFGAGEIDVCVVGADRIAGNGDVANKIGTYSVAVLARWHERPFYVAAPWSTVDLDCPSGARIPIEQRARAEIAEIEGRQLVVAEAGVKNPAFDVTPAGLITAVFTERGVVAPVSPAGLLAIGGAKVSELG